ncbi:MAG: putative porin, partial [Gammaproteobacteria bacterium]
MKATRRLLTALLLAHFLTPGAAADERTELLEMKNTILNLVDALVEEGILSEEKASTIKTEAAARARTDAAREIETEEPPMDQASDAPTSGASKVVRVPYVPEFVKDEIREQVRAELRE